ncbi:carbohydrate phosphatase [Parathielavia appendiculata]|uniref:Carbohydrate phosphatase n=1 Tax=Parathielavia appendiculata TaxID=2587402 RepID=A0AAN6TTJ3_9PEZI|nr:carbohydrate phosphatase [Parathielavia appendiculata]
MDSPYRRELEVAIAAAQTAARISREVLSTAQADATAGTFDLVKDDLSFVTVADFAIQALLTRTLQAAFPDDGFIGEESADELRQNPKLLARVLAVLAQCASETLFHDANDLCNVIDSCTTLIPGASPGRTWVFDPIDGTKTFIRREQYAINIALLDEGGRQVLSVVACPLLAVNHDITTPLTDTSIDPTGRGSLLYAVRGHGAYIRPLLLPGAADSDNDMINSHTRKLPRHADTATSTTDLRSVTCWTQLDSGLGAVHQAVASQLSTPFPGSDLLGWVPRWACLALGAANMTVWVYHSRSRRAKIWDHAGAMLLVEEVGGRITDVHGNEIDLTAGRKLERNFGFVAAPTSLHAIVLETVHDTLRASGREELLR